MNCDLNTLLPEIGCFMCLSEQQILAIIAYLYCVEWTNSQRVT